MALIKTTVNRRSFLKATLLAGGGMLLHFSWLAGCKPVGDKALEVPEEWFELNSYIKIGENGVVTLYNPNPEFGQNVKTSMPMILAEELDVDWKQVIVEQADFYPERFERQFTGGSQSIRQGWSPLRMAGATARQMLVLAAATKWNVPASEITTERGMLMHKTSGKKAGYGEVASAAAAIQVPKEVKLKDVSDFTIIGSSKKNVELSNILSGKPLFTLDYKAEGMLIAMIVHPPAFGMRLKSIDDSVAKTMPGIKSIFVFDSLTSDIAQTFFDTTSFTRFAAIVGNSTWEVLQAKKALKVEWEEEPERVFKKSAAWWELDGPAVEAKYPAGLESTDVHRSKMTELSKKPGNILRRDGDPEKAFASAEKILERTFTGPFLAHNTMEPVSCFAHVTADKASFYGPMQTPEFLRATLAKRLGLPRENVHIKLARMGGGFGRRGYGHHFIEAAVISKQVQAPVKLIYTREDEMTAGIYRPAYSVTYRAALDEKNNLLAFHVKGGGLSESPVHPSRFPAGAVDNYLAESWTLPSNITIGTFRAPGSNFMAAAEQSFLDELAAEMGKDPIDFRLELLERAKKNPVGKDNDYDAARYAGVLELVRDKSGWKETPQGVHRGVSAYFCHNSYVAEVVDLILNNNTPKVERVVAAIDCGIVVNKDAAINMAEGAIIDGIGNALYGELPFKDGVPQKNNFTTYRMIRMNEAPKAIEVHFVQSEQEPSGLGEPPFPPVFAAVANALFKASGKRFYNQPFINELEKST
ncbi:MULTISPECIES: xanthine dehydrogenase family protein molybdopterin-binding subunit [unclassified Sphingobacterium]|uniref:xanthine dehydrogenase family protein molybdopterin-binding subunit n=1 Tax=unclassified Sphingobacterium TaxID=2609468 RepID=UPI0025FCCF10|nr:MULTISPECIES: molybdopterin cofactor-binding domain-containing protein [unclassified Sphingobacterium]